MTATTASPNKIYELVGALIRSERNRQKITQEALAERVGLQRTSITNIEKGKQKLLLHTLVHLAAALSISPKELLQPLECVLTSDFESTLPQNLSPSVKNWIVSGLATANKNKK